MVKVGGQVCPYIREATKEQSAFVRGGLVFRN